MTEQDTERFLKRALQLAADAAGGVSPRPPVGAVIVRSGQVVGEGQTEPRPGLHAEAAAIRNAGDASRGATMYCTLEPHAHQGIAPPCTEKIINAGIARVVCPIEDPNPQVNGNGFRQLRAAGIEVVTDVPVKLKETAEDLIRGFAIFMSKGRPRFTLKYAMSLDGKIATSTGESQWITGKAARAEAHLLRRSSDAVVTGIGTIIADNPRLTARNADGLPTGRPRLRVVLDTSGRMPLDSALLNENGTVLWVRGAELPATQVDSHVEMVELTASNSTASGGIDLVALAKLLADRECCDVLVEAGGKLAGAFLAAGLIDRVAAFIGPVVIGGDSAPGPFGGVGIASLTDALRLEQVRVKQLGTDFLVTGNVVRPV